MEKYQGELAINIYELLPSPYKITRGQMHIFWECLYSDLQKAFEKDDFFEINNIFIDTRYLGEYHIAKPPEDLGCQLITLLYKIITTLPIKNYHSQITACNVTHNLMMLHIRPNDMVLPWRPLFDFVRYIFLKDDLSFLTKNSPNSIDVLHIISDLSPYFPRSATREIVDMLLPRISPRGSYASLYITFMSMFIPVIDCDYKDWFPNFISEIKDTGSLERFSPIFKLVYRIMHHNIQDDFSCMIPLVMNCFVQVIVNEYTPDFVAVEKVYEFLDQLETFSTLTSYISSSMLILCLSPPSRRAAIEQLTTVLNNTRDLFHPSISLNSPSMMLHFLQSFVYKLRNHYREMYRKKSFISIDTAPSKEELHLMLKPIVDLHLIMIHILTPSELLNLINTIRIICEFDPSANIRYFEYAYQCIMLTDAEYVSEQGWTVMTAVLIGMKNDTDLFEKHIQEIFELAVNNFFVVELQIVLARFFFVVFSIFPFDRKLASDKLDPKFPFEDLAVKFLTAVIDAARSFPALQGKYARVNAILEKTAALLFHAFFMGASREILKALLPVLTTTLFDTSVMHSFGFFAVIYNYFFIVADDEIRQPLLSTMRSILSSNPDTMTTITMIRRYIRAAAISAKSNEDYEETLNFVMPYTKHPVSKIRKNTWYSIGNSLFFDNIIILVKPTKDMKIPFDEFKFQIYRLSVDTRSMIPKFVDPFLEKIMTLTDPKEIYEILNEMRAFLLSIFDFTEYVDEGKDECISPLFKKSPFYIEELIKPVVPLREKFYKLILHLFDNFPDNVQILNLILIFTNGLLCPILNNFTWSFNNEMTLIKSIWSTTPLRNKYNIFELSNRVAFQYKHRKSQYHVPLCPLLKQIFCRIVDLGFSKFKNIRTKACLLINGVVSDFQGLFPDLIRKYLENTDVEVVDEILDFLTYNGIFCLITKDEDLLVTILRHICTKLKADDQSTMTSLQSFVSALCSNVYPFGIPKDHSELWDKLLTDILNHVENDKRKDRTLHLTVTGVISTALKFTKSTSDDVILYLIERIKMCDESIMIQAVMAIMVILKRNQKQKCFVKPLNPPRISDYAPFLTDRTFTENNETSPEDLLDSVTDEDFRLELPENISALDKQSNGWHIYTENYTVKEVEFWTDSPLNEHLPEILMTSILSTDEIAANTKPYIGLLWKHIAHIIGPTSLDYLSDLFIQTLEEPLNEATAVALSEFMHGYLLAIPYWNTKDIVSFERRFFFPFIIYSAQNPSICDTTQSLFLLTAYSLDARRLTPLINFLLKNCDSAPEANLTRRRLFDMLTTIVSWQNTTFFTSMDILFKRFLLPFFADYSEYSTTLVATLLFLFISLVESTCFPSGSPKYSPELEIKRKELVQQFNEVVKKSDPTQKSFHQLLSVSLQYMDMASMLAVESLMPVYLDNIEIIMKAINSTDINTEDILESSFSVFLMNPIFTNNSHLALEIVQRIIKSFDILSPPMQLKLIQSFTEMMKNNIHSFSRDDLNQLYELFYQLAKHTKNENVHLEIITILGLVLKFIPPLKELGKIEAMAILVFALLFDEVDDQILRAFEIVKHAIENSPQNKTSLLKTVVRRFWAMNADHMLPRVEDQLSQYRLLISPSYIS